MQTKVINGRMLLDQIKNRLHEHLKKRETLEVGTLRFLLAGIQQAGIAKYANQSDSRLTDEDIVDVIKKQVKSHKESILAFTEAGRSELVEKESGELAILESYLPPQMDDESLKHLLLPLISQGETNFGLLMKNAMAKAAGRADGSRVSAMLKSLISQRTV